MERLFLRMIALRIYNTNSNIFTNSDKILEKILNKDRSYELATEISNDNRRLKEIKKCYLYEYYK